VSCLPDPQTPAAAAASHARAHAADDGVHPEEALFAERAAAAREQWTACR
jgi:hypothetical protein